MPLPQITNPRIDWSALKDNIAGTLTDQLTKLIQGAEADVAAYAGEIALDLTEAMQAATPEIRDGLVEELKGQLETIAEINRIRGNEAAWATVNSIVHVVAQVAIGALVAAV